MRVHGASFTENVYQLYQKNQTTPQETTYQDLLQATAGEIQNAQEPKVQIWADYQNWKAQQPPRKLPESQGATEENMAYLRENFTGELSLFQRIDALDTMREMGMITQDQMMSTLGFGTFSLYTVDPDKLIICTGAPGNEEYLHKWTQFFWGAPVMKSDSLEALFELLDEQLRFDGEEDVAGEIEDVLNRVTRKIHE